MGMRDRWGGCARLLLVLLVAGAVRGAYLIAYHGSPFFGYYRNDQLYYRSWGLQIAGGDLLGDQVFEQGPLYAYFLGPLFRLFGSGATSVLALQCLCGLATVSLVFWCARSLYGERAGLLSGLFAAVYGPFVFYECMLMKTFLEPLLVLATLAATLRGLSSGRSRWFGAAGAALGFACLVREVHALLLIPLLAAAVLSAPARPASRRGRVLAAAGVLLAFFAAIVPAALRNWVVAREPVAVSSAGGQNMYIAFGPFATGAFTLPPFAGSFPFQEHDDFREEAMLRTGRRLTREESSRYWLEETARWVRTAPGRTLDLVAVKAGILFNDYEVPDSENYGVTRNLIPLLSLLPTFGWFAGAGLLGFLLAFRFGGPARVAAAFAAILVLEVLLTFNLGRYRAGLAALWLIFAGGWLDSMLRAVPGRRGILVRRAGPVALASILALAAFRVPPRLDAERIARERETFRAEVREGAGFAARIPALRLAVAGEPRNPRLLADLGLALEVSGRLPETLATYEEVLRLAPDAATVRIKLADIYAKTGQLDRAAEQARFLAAALPGDAAAHALHAAVLMRQSMHAPDGETAARFLGEAREAVRRAVALRPLDGEPRLLSGRILMFPGRDAEAAVELDAARGLAPGLDEAGRLLGIIGGRIGSSESGGQVDHE